MRVQAICETSLEHWVSRTALDTVTVARALELEHEILPRETRAVVKVSSVTSLRISLGLKCPGAL